VNARSARSPSPARRPPTLLVAALALVLIALIDAGLWRLELAWRGWDGLGWIDWFHLALPAGIALFVGWVLRITSLAPRARLRLGVMLAVTAAGLGALASWSLRLGFATGSRALPLATMSPVLAVALRMAWVPVLLSAPIAMCAIARSTGLRVTLLRAAISVAVFCAALPLARALLVVTGHRGGSDAVHALKSGFVIPWLVIGLGIPFLRTPSSQT